MNYYNETVSIIMFNLQTDVDPIKWTSRRLTSQAINSNVMVLDNSVVLPSSSSYKLKAFHQMCSNLINQSTHLCCIQSLICHLVISVNLITHIYDNLVKYLAIIEIVIDRVKRRYRLTPSRFSI